MADNGDSFFKGLLIGGIIGGVLGVLYAPKSGKETREELSEESDKLLNQFKADIENAKKAALRSFDHSKDMLIEKLSNDDEPAEVAEEEKVSREKSKPKRPRSTKSKRDKSA